MTHDEIRLAFHAHRVTGVALGTGIEEAILKRLDSLEADLFRAIHDSEVAQEYAALVIKERANLRKASDALAGAIFRYQANIHVNVLDALFLYDKVQKGKNEVQENEG